MRLSDLKTDNLSFYLWSGRGFGIQAKNTSSKLRMKFDLSLKEVKQEDPDYEDSLKLVNSQPKEINQKTERFYADF